MLTISKKVVALLSFSGIWAGFCHEKPSCALSY